MENNYTDILKLDSYSLKEIERVCKDNKYVGKENLTEQLEFDRAVLNSMKVTIKDIITTHKNMVLRLNKTNNYRQFTTQDPHNDNLKKIQSEMDDTLKRNRDYEETVYNQIDMNNSTFQILCETTTNYKVCEISKHFDNSEDAILFDKDYFIYNVRKKTGMWVSDMVMYQIEKYGFFHGVSSSRRIDPIKYIEVMELDMMGTAELPIVPLETFEAFRWRSVGDISGEIHDVSECISNEIYDCYVYQRKTKICIQFKDKNWLQNNRDTLIKIAKVNMMIVDQHQTDIWYDYNIVRDVFVKNEDTTEMNNMITLYDQRIFEKKGKLIFDDILNLVSVH